MKQGDWVEALAYGGEKLRRRVVAVEPDKVYICTDEEYQAAVRDRREPTSVGFNPGNVRLV